MPSLSLFRPTGDNFWPGVHDVAKQVPQETTCIRIVSREVFSGRLSILAQFHLRGECLHRLSSYFGIDQVDNIDINRINRLRAHTRVSAM